MEILQGRQRLLLSEKGKRGAEFHLAVLQGWILKDPSEPG